MKGIGKIYEVDLEYPDELHHLHNDYPCTAEKIKVTDEMLSDYCKRIKNKYNISSGNVHKLIPTLNDKEKYIKYINEYAACERRICKRSDQPKINRITNNDARLILR